jgi:hypothetical protein
MLIAGNSIAECTTASSNKDKSLPLIKDILYRALQKRGLSIVGEYCNIASADLAEGKEAYSGQRDKAICSSISILRNKVGNTQGKLYSVL